MTAQPGTYALVLECRKTDLLRVGRLGRLRLQPGFYVYVGSAFGPGGLAARIQHHRHLAARPHWHIDYLRAACELIDVWFTADRVRREHSWANDVARLQGAGIPMPGFGSSDCQCETHLFLFKTRPSLSSFKREIKTPVMRLGIRQPPQGSSAFQDRY